MYYKKCIIIVEGNVEVRRNLIEALIARDFDVFAYDKAERVLNASIISYVDAIIMSAQLPGINGWTAISLIRQHHPQIPVILLSTCNDANYITKPEIEVNDYILVPFLMEDLVARLKIVLERFEMVHGIKSYLRN